VHGLSGGVRNGSPLKKSSPAAGTGTVTVVATPVGDAEVLLETPSAPVLALLVLGHGAGGDIDAPDLVMLRDEALRSAIAVARVRQPYRVIGRRAPAPAGQLDAAWLAVVAALRDPGGRFAKQHRRLRGGPVVVAGRSNGARVACRTAGACRAAAVLASAFPLHPPGRPDRSRAPELAIASPLLVLQGGRDPFGRPDEFPSGISVIEVPGADHALRTAAFEAAASHAVEWILQRAPGAASAAGNRRPVDRVVTT
jgi:uncharacterized protein